MSGYQPPAGQPSVLVADEAIVVIDKPAGLLSVPGRGDDKADCALSRVHRLFPDALAVHRLDLATSGLLLFARGASAHRDLSRQFAQARVRKSYLALCWGQPAPRDGTISLPIIADWPNRPLQKVDHACGKPSLTRYETLSSDGRVSRLRLHPETGRSHQLRLHLAAIGHPLLGDEFYAHAEARAAASRLCLHATELSFTHPANARTINVVADCPF